MMPDGLVDELHELLASAPDDLLRAALIIARVEYPRLRPAATIDAVDRLGDVARARLAAVEGAPLGERIAALGRFLYEEQGFDGNRDNYGDFRNSLINVVVERRTGIPITLALVYREVSRRVGLEVFGVSFPGHFLLRAPAGAGEDDLIILDPFEGGRRLGLADCQALFRRHVGASGEFVADLLRPCTNRQFLARMLNNLKRVYIEQRSFVQARAVTDLLLAIEPTVGVELRDRGLLAYHLNDFPSALQDLETYLRLRTWDARDRDEHERILEHIKALRHRVAGFN